MASKSSATPRLVIIEGKDKGKVIPLQDGTAVIGRSKGDVLIQDPRVSRSHAAIHYDANLGKLSFTDLKSLNGTQVNGKTTDNGDLHDGDKLQLGDTVFDCQISSSLEAEEASHTYVPPSPPPSARTQEHSWKAPEPNRYAKDSEHSLPISPSTHSGITGELREEEEPPPEEPLSLWRQAYLNVPPKLRKAGLVVVLIAFVLSVYPRGKSTANLEREIASVRKLESQGKISEAITKAQELKSIYPDHSLTFFTLGDLLAQQGKNDAAIVAYRGVETCRSTDQGWSPNKRSHH
jgi:pSer/pThr/pTyr-binding forkhead associated (FHA) protein